MFDRSTRIIDIALIMIHIYGNNMFNWQEIYSNLLQMQGVMINEGSSLVSGLCSLFQVIQVNLATFQVLKLEN